MRVKSRKEEQSDATRAGLISVARRLFAERGFAEVATEEIVQAAGVTRGALYHHFTDKAHLFQAVVDDIEREISSRVRVVTDAIDDPFERLGAACETFLDAYLEPEFQRIEIIDAAAVLGSEKWCRIVHQHTAGILRELLEQAVAAGVVEDQPADTLAHLLLGALNVGARVITRAEDPMAARRTVGATADRILTGLRTPAPV